MAKRYSLREANVRLIDCEHRTPPAAEIGYPYVAIPQIKNGRIDLKDARRIRKEHFLSWTRKAFPQPYDVVLSRRCNPGETAFVPPGLEFALGQNLVLLRADGTKIYPPFLRWLVRGTEWWQEIAKFINVGAIFESLKCADIPNFRLTIPPLSDQHAIADILNALDDKIELNHGMNETLEAMARAVFKSWFVDFDPVRAKAEGRQPFGMDAASAALFPKSFSRTPTGMIPEDWRVSNLGGELTTLLGGTPSRSNPAYWTDGTVPWINSGKVNEFRIIEPSEYLTEDAVRNSATKILPRRTTVIAITGATLGQVSLLEIESCANQSVVGVLGSDTIPSEYVYFWIKQNIADLIAWQTGGAQQHINKENVNKLPLTRPSTSVLQAYMSLVKPIFDKIRNNCFESLTLARTRDSLLPKLISGEIHVKDSEKIVGEKV